MSHFRTRSANREKQGNSAKVRFLMKGKFKLSALFILLCAALVITVFLPSCSSNDTDMTEITSVHIKNDKKTVKVEATLSREYLSENSGERIYLLALDSAYTDKIENFTVVGNSKAKSKMTFKFELNNQSDSYLSSFFVLAKSISGDEDTGEYTAISKAAYIDNPDIFSKNSTKPEDGFKGIFSSDVYASELLGASSILFEASMDKLMLPEYKDGAINYVYGGRSYYFDGEEVSDLDKKISEANALGMRVYLRTVLKHPEKDKYGNYIKEPIAALYHPDVKDGKNGYLPYLSGEGVGYVKAFYDFLGSRYDVKDKSLGNVYDYVIGEGANSFANNCNAGTSSSERILADYYSWAKIADSILRSYCKNTQVYVSVDNRLRNEATSGSVGSEAFLESFAAISNFSKDWNFAIALGLGTGEDLSELLSGSEGSLSSVGALSLADFLALTESEGLQIGDKARRVLIDSLALPITLSEKNRAAYYTYTYYKASELGIDTFIYSADAPNAALLSASGKRSDLYYSYLMCGSDITDQLHDYTDKIPNAPIPSFSDHCSRKLTYEQNVKIELSASLGKSKKSFPIELETFKAAGAAQNADISYISSNKNEIQTLTVSGNTASVCSAVTSFGVTADKLIESGYIGITMSSPTPLNVALIISDNSNNAAYVGEAEVSSIPESYFFNVTRFTNDIKASDELTISICVLPSDKAETCSLSVSEIALYGSSGNGSSTVVSIIIVIVVTLGICGLLFLLTRRRKKRRYDYDYESSEE